MANNKVQLVTGEVLIDLTPVTVDAAHLAQGYTAHDKSGAAITGTGQTATSPYREETYNADGELISVVIHGNVPKIRKYEFRTTTYIISYLQSVTYPSSVTAIEEGAFDNCVNLTMNSIPSNIVSIGLTAFQNCTSLTTMTFKGTPNTIEADAFNGCTNLRTINVPWASGAVANAPWGATNATINYNHRG